MFHGHRSSAEDVPDWRSLRSWFLVFIMVFVQGGCVYTSTSEVPVKRATQIEKFKVIRRAIISLERRNGGRKIEELSNQAEAKDVSWRVLILEEIGEPAIAKQLLKVREKDRTQSRHVAIKMPSVYRSDLLPQLPRGGSDSMTNFVIFSDEFGNRFVGDCGLTYIPWTKVDRVGELRCFGSPCFPGYFVSIDIESGEVVLWDEKLQRIADVEVSE